MNTLSQRIRNPISLIFICLLMTSCDSIMKKNMNKKSDPVKGSYGFDLEFFERNNLDFIDLKDSLSDAHILIIPAYQGRVMTSTADGAGGKSYGWINYGHIESGIVNPQFNPYGGEERLWLGPEGGPFSLYFSKGEEQVFQNWNVPAEIDTVKFDVLSRSNNRVTFGKDFVLVNASGNSFPMGIERSIQLLSRKEAEGALGISFNDSLKFVAYESRNKLTNLGESKWDKTTGAPSLWMLSMFNPSEKGVVFIPFKPGSNEELGKIVTDDYFGKVPSDRLIIRDEILFFKTDGKLRSKIGISPKRAMPFCGSYDPHSRSLTLLWFSGPMPDSGYVNSMWGEQENPFSGDAVNSYNDGAVEDGSIMGPFYEIESSSPAAFLSPSDSLIHSQRIFHITGNESFLTRITEELFGITLDEIKSVF